MSAEPQALLYAIERELKVLSWWQSVPPSAKALASTEPFCLDTLTFPQWLQFVLLPRMQALIDSGAPLPSRISVYPMAIESCKLLAEDTRALEEAIARLDEALSGQRVSREG
ncbi:YqcC family protein [Zobellella iuensis]|uniref:YqcC family protein n=1 Tax=Zobellella iuensis TaxID=2803811 RepID=A0ABS1QTW0_9GAMM|nr:YqcC family protein [Zobellella iuensis]MBL1378309.1 YqcC family protein [Zobellella iuensis]